MADTVDTEATVVETSKVVKMKALTPEVFNAALAYLDTRPHNEVRNIIDSLSSSPLIDVTITNVPDPSQATK